tara:strand:+ start:155 stop:439 length:285 start_codon:yes stop_codon:yes gene_type:complete
MEMPFLGGIYFRYYPNPVIRLLRSQLREGQVPWFYCHPYDFYWDKAYIQMRDTPLWVNVLLMGRRRHAMQKMRRFFKPYQSSRTFYQLIQDQTA